MENLIVEGSLILNIILLLFFVGSAFGVLSVLFQDTPLGGLFSSISCGSTMESLVILAVIVWILTVLGG